MLPTRDPLQIQRYTQVERKEMEKDISYKWNKKNKNKKNLQQYFRQTKQTGKQRLRDKEAPSYSISWYFPGETQNINSKYLRTPMFIAAFTTAT